jgi:hypothetical protein
MSESFGLRTRFETDGVFWDAKNPERTFSGHLSSARHIELTTSAEIAGPERWFPNPKADGPAPENVLGHTTSIGPCSLIGLHEIPGSRSLNAETGQTIVSRRYRVDACIIGCHIQNDLAPLLCSGWFACSGIDEWFPGCAETAITEDGVSLFFRSKAPAIVDFCLLCLRSRVEIVVNPNLRFSPAGKRVSARSQPQIRLEPETPRSLEWLMDVAWRFENFFSLCLGTSVRLHTVSLETLAGKKGWLIAHRRDIKAEETDVQSWVKCDHLKLAAAIANWFSLSEVFRPLENLLFGVIRASSPVSEQEFLALAQAIESFHRMTDSSTTIATAAFRLIFKSLRKTIIDQYGGSPIVTRLCDSIRYCNEPSFQYRVESLLKRLSARNAEKLLGDLSKFEQTLRQTRNYFTHPGIKKKSRVLPAGPDIFLFNQKLHAFLRLLMLLYLGFSEDTAFEAVYYQSRKWRIL